MRIVVKGRGCNCFRVGQAVMAGPHLSALGLQATTVEVHGLYPTLLQLTVERKITASHLTMGLGCMFCNKKHFKIPTICVWLA